MPERPDRPAAFAGGRYRVDRLLGEGAHKEVYLARDTTLNRDVAIAVIRAAAFGPERAERVRREAQAMGRMPAHVNVVSVFDAGEHAGRPFIVEEYVPGGTVADLLARDPGRPLPIARAVEIAADVCAALGHAHGHGIVHRDLKPANVWLDGNGVAKLGDFGLVATLELSASATVERLTQEGGMVGTLAYIAPEQALGRPPDPRSDLYSLGVMLYELVTARLPFAADDALGVISQHLRTPPVAPGRHNPEVPAALDALITRLLAKAPDDRPQRAEEVAAALDAVQASTTDRTPATRSTPDPLARLAGGVHVGRRHELDELSVAADLAFAGQGRLVLITGEPGIGKTRLAEELTTYARLQGALVLWGRCYEGEGAPPYWPWVQIVRAYAAGHDPDTLAATMGSGAADIAQVVSEVGRRLPDLDPTPTLEPEQARFRLFDSVTTFLVNASRHEPLVIVLDDLHSADGPSLLLLEFVARELGHVHMLVVATYRDIELPRSQPLAHLLGELTRVHPPQRISLDGLTRSEVGRYIEMTAGLDPTPGLIDAVHRKTDGNPLFVGEVLRLLSAEGRLERFESETGGEVTIPPEVRDVLARRLERLSPPCRSALSVAAVIGREFHLRVLNAVADLPAGQLLDVLHEAEAARVVTAAGRGRYRFTHVAVGDALAENVAVGRRLDLHRRIGEALERQFPDRLDAHLAELAHHFLETAPGGDLDKALRYAVAAAEHAASRLAYEDAARLYERGLEALELAGQDGDRRCDLLLALGHAWAHAASIQPARAAFRQAADDARRLPSPERLADAVLGFAGPRAAWAVVDDEIVTILEEALAALGHRDEALRARLLARLAMELHFADAPERPAALAHEAVAAARSAGDPATLGYVLNAGVIALWGPEGAQERAAMTDEIIELAERTEDLELACEGYARRVVALLERGDLPAARAEIDVHARIARKLRQPSGLWQSLVWQCMEATLAGRFEDALTRAEEALDRGRRVRVPDAENAYVSQTLLPKIELGRVTELEASVQDMIDRYPAVPWSVARLRMHAMAGNREETADAYARLMAAGVGRLKRDRVWLLLVLGLVEGCALLGDVDHTGELETLLRPYSGRTVFSGEGWACYGASDRWLGMLAATTRRWNEAEAYFDSALRQNARLGARSWLARTQFAYAQMLLARGAPEDIPRARTLATGALSIARELGMTTVARRVQAELVGPAR